MEIAFDIGAGIMLAMGNNTCKSKGERVSKVSVPTFERRGADIGLVSWVEEEPPKTKIRSWYESMNSHIYTETRVGPKTGGSSGEYCAMDESLTQQHRKSTGDNDQCEESAVQETCQQTR
jgi:hypothetical protein